MLDIELEHTEQDLKNNLENGHKYLERGQYEKAIEAYKEARTVASALKLTARFNDLDRLVARARDQAEGYARMKHLAGLLTQQIDRREQFESLVELHQMVGLFSAMEYRGLANLVRETIQSFAASLSAEEILVLSDIVMAQGDYQLVLILSEGIQTSENTPLYKVQQKAKQLRENKVLPRLAEAERFMNQGHPLDGLEPLRELRRELPKCSDWRELWFALCRKQGEFLVEHGGRQNLAEARYAEALNFLKKAYKAFECGLEAYPEAVSSQRLLLEVKDLLEITQSMDTAQSLLQAQQNIEALRQFRTLHNRLTVLANQNREYSLIKYGLMLQIERLEDTVGRDVSARGLLDQAMDAWKANEREQAALLLAQFSEYPEEIRQMFADEYKALSERFQDTKTPQSEPDIMEMGTPVPLVSVAIAETASSSDSSLSGASGEPASLSPSVTLERLSQWMSEIEPLVAEARAAFLQGNTQVAVESFQTLFNRLQDEG